MIEYKTPYDALPRHVSHFLQYPDVTDFPSTYALYSHHKIAGYILTPTHVSGMNDLNFIIAFTRTTYFTVDND